MWSFILKFILPFIVDLALKYGLPPAMEWVLKRFPFIPKDVLEGIVSVIKKAIEDLQAAPTPASKEVIRAVAKRDAKRRCSGTSCVSETKAL